MEERYIRIEISRRRLAWCLAIALLAGVSLKLFADTMTMTTYYPSPTGIYQRLTTTAATILARDSGDVGIGTTAPQAKLDVNGDAIVRMNATVSGNAVVQGSAFIGGYVRGATHGFGGIYTTYPRGGCRYANPFTGACSCPEGFWASPFHDYIAGPGQYSEDPAHGYGVLEFQCVR